jgi:hypothetical protein
MISAEELSLEIRESDDSLHNIFLKHNLDLETTFKLLEKRKGKTAHNRNKDYVYLKRRVYIVKKNDVNYGQYQTLEEAQSIVKELKKYDWDKNKLCDIQEDLEIYEYSTVPSKMGYSKVYKRHGSFMFKDLKSDTIKGLHRLMHENGYTLKKSPKQKGRS